MGINHWILGWSTFHTSPSSQGTRFCGWSEVCGTRFAKPQIFTFPWDPNWADISWDFWSPSQGKWSSDVVKELNHLNVCVWVGYPPPSNMAAITMLANDYWENMHPLIIKDCSRKSPANEGFNDHITKKCGIFPSSRVTRNTQRVYNWTREFPFASLKAMERWLEFDFRDRFGASAMPPLP